MQLERLILSEIDGKTHWRVFSLLHPAGAPPAVQALTPNPRSKGRFALISGHIGMLYVGSSRCAALWEAVLARASILHGGGVYVLPRLLADNAIAQLERTDDPAPACLDLRSPQRYLVASANSPCDTAIEALLTTPIYTLTHVAAAQAQRSFNGDGLTLPSIVYPSRRVASDWAVVCYHPPIQGSAWTCTEPTIRLDTPDGRALIDRELRPHGFHLVGDPVEDPDATPPDGEE